MVGFGCMIYQKVNYILNFSYFRENSQNVRTNIRTMSNVDNYNKYNYDQVMDEKYTEQG